MEATDLSRRLVLLNDHESFWLDCLRAACKGQVPRPTLARAQALRRLFSAQTPPLGTEEADHGQP
ncbi:hypothetical protein SAMN02983003_1668 [Devosia enhydra]|uniref:Uncharacterized protein n=1 Tax=Devosia enhydra TaxID=665118 RepID=A0A1K2HWN4_9HYPH|nr:hypothetical protein [Devosia enhydra]SFZ83475.1 hypothetical protein SAMN02983003_1668 [Devosia enhydra]